MPFKWDVPPEQAFSDLVENYTKALFVTGRRVADARAEEATAWMKANHPWQNRTGAAEAGLHVDVTQAPAIVAELTFAHGDDVPYGIWLEIANGGRFAIIAPAIDYWGSRLMQDMQRIINLGLAAKG